MESSSSATLNTHTHTHTPRFLCHWPIFVELLWVRLFPSRELLGIFVALLLQPDVHSVASLQLNALNGDRHVVFMAYEKYAIL